MRGKSVGSREGDVDPVPCRSTIRTLTEPRTRPMQFHCMIYFDPKVVFANTPEAQALLAAIGPHTAELTASGKLVLSLPLNLPQEAVTVKVREGVTSTTDGPFMETKEVLGGFALIEAKDLAEAIEIASTLPHASLGHVEVRPAIDFSKPRPQF